MRKAEVTNFVEFIQETDFLDLLVDLMIFRGQANKGNLLPSIARKNPRANTKKKEKQILEQLKLQGASMLESAGSTDLDLLVMGQHYGLATRLLDCR